MSSASAPAAAQPKPTADQPSPAAAAAGTPRLRQDAARNRDRIISAACVVFAERGVDACVEEIARQAGVGVGTLYRRFPTKEHLLRQIAEDLLRELLDGARAELGAADGGGLERTIRQCALLQVSRRGYMMQAFDTALPDDLRSAFRLTLADLLTEAQAAGTIRAEVTAADIIMVLWSLRGVVDMSAAASGAAAVERFLDLVLAGLRPSTVELTQPPVTGI